MDFNANGCHQVEENTILRSELQSKIQELDKYKISEPLAERSHSVDQWNERVHQSVSSAVGDPTSVLVPDNGDPATQSHVWKQDFALKVRENEEEIMQLKKHLADYSVKEAQIRNEKYVLEKRIAYMRLAFDQQQQDLVDAASKALSYRQDIIEENIRLTYELQAAQQERSTFVSSLLPLLAEYSWQPPVPDAQSIVSNVKSKLKESQYQLAPWRSDVNHSNFAPQSPSHAALRKSGLELVPQPTYSHGKIPMTSSDTQTASDWDPLSQHQSGLAGGVAKNLDLDDAGRYSPLAGR
ncbi:unnamed protein product [Dovyalis caffra]|uniref:Uncharacterized protein n=1 Tax=Dovyalis caffra TaxID=77055 RepID=A0AAV1R7X6_9ROSI|nr:unnamed protein product [Dovyalis caffra]